MTIGKKIKRIRKLRGLTQAQLGVAAGFSSHTACVRIAQYESDSRVPKAEQLKKIAKALNVSDCALCASVPWQSGYDVFLGLFENGDECPGVVLERCENPEKGLIIRFEEPMFNEWVLEWQKKKEELDGGEISEDDYLKWKLDIMQRTHIII